jgi:hypothetical protein
MYPKAKEIQYFNLDSKHVSMCNLQDEQMGEGLIILSHAATLRR